MNAAVTFQIGLNESARAIRGKFTFAGAWESCCRMRTEVNEASRHCIVDGIIPGPISVLVLTCNDMRSYSSVVNEIMCRYGIIFYARRFDCQIKETWLT